MKISTFATDLDLEENGVWVDLGDGGSILVARWDNPHYQKFVREALRPHRAAIRKRTLSDEISDDVVLRAYANTILLDWKGLEDDKGKAIKYSIEAAYDLMKGMKDFKALVVEIAGEAATFRRENLEEEGNG